MVYFYPIFIGFGENSSYIPHTNNLFVIDGPVVFPPACAILCLKTEYALIKLFPDKLVQLGICVYSLNLLNSKELL